jgi:4-hydroxy-3-methylbut-2-en-1-yl diphosphate synthase IspG/GcpE
LVRIASRSPTCSRVSANVSAAYEQFRHRADPQHSGAPKGGVVDGIGPGKDAGMGRGGAGTRIRPARL